MFLHSALGTLAIQLGGTTAGDLLGYDQVQAAGITLSGATLHLSLTNGFTPQFGDTFYILDNTSSDAAKLTSGLFSNGLTASDDQAHTYLINYSAIDPNNSAGLPVRDISLTFVPEPFTWMLLSSGARLLCLRVLAPALFRAASVTPGRRPLRLPSLQRDTRSGGARVYNRAPVGSL
ncbi:MAG: hypothetical protein ACR2FX_08180 [Chthoniobacterales bacterium]